MPKPGERAGAGPNLRNLPKPVGTGWGPSGCNRNLRDRPELFGRNCSVGTGRHREPVRTATVADSRGQSRSPFGKAVRESHPAKLSGKSFRKNPSERIVRESRSGRRIRKTYPEKPSGKTGQADASGRRIRPGRSANSSGPGRSADPVSKAGRKAIPSKSLSFPLPVPFPESGRAAVQVQAVPGAPLPVSVPVFQARSPEIRPTGQSVPDAVQI